MKLLRAVIRGTKSNYKSAYPVEGCAALKCWLRIFQRLKLIYPYKHIQAFTSSTHGNTINL